MTSKFHVIDIRCILATTLVWVWVWGLASVQIRIIKSALEWFFLHMKNHYTCLHINWESRLSNGFQFSLLFKFFTSSNSRFQHQHKYFKKSDILTRLLYFLLDRLRSEVVRFRLSEVGWGLGLGSGLGLGWGWGKLFPQLGNIVAH